MKFLKTHIIIGFTLLFLAVPKLQSQTVEALGRLSTDSIAIGQHLVFELNMKVPGGFKVDWPQWGDTLTGNLEILQQGQTEVLPVDKDGNMVMRQQLVLTSFDTGWVYIPGIDIKFAPEGDTVFYAAQSNPLMLRVGAIAVDTTATFKPIKNIESAPITFAEVLPWIIGLLGIAALLFAIVWFYMRRRNKPVTLAPILKPQIPPHLLALEQLEELRHQKLWQSGRVKDYYTGLSDIIRAYIEARFPVNAIEMTTHEILIGLQTSGINPEAMSKLSNALELADLVKFAKAQPTAVENDLSISHLVDFVNESHAVAQTDNEAEMDKEEAS
ncbi:MAG: hypothetical protein Q7V19_17190 [Bacteroidales bacterium]|jgi:hypothetical protein|nr:hypothetical protein [Bacteroidales bacterium]MDP2237455.1 hypothetical protein [Bacteroidales bacterium]